MNAQRGAVYARLSIKGRAGKVVPVEEQDAKERRRMKSDGVECIGTFQDDGYSAWRPGVQRPGFLDLLALIENGGVDWVYATYADRLVRQSLDGETLIAVCAANGVMVKEDGAEVDLADEDAADMFRIKTMFNRRYSSSISRKVKDARQLTAEAGRPHPGGQRPFGYNDDRRTLHKVEGKAYRELFDRVIGGEGVIMIARDWERRGIVNRNGARFNTTSMLALVRAPRAIGLRQHRGEVLDGVVGDWTPIVTPEKQASAIAALKSRRTLRTVTPQRRVRLLSSLVECAVCHRTMRLWAGKDRGGVERVRYVCDRTKAGRCGGVTVAAEQAERKVITDFLAMLSDPKTQRALDKLRKEQPDVSGYLDELTRLRTEIEAYAKDAAKRSDEDGYITRAEFQIVRKGLQRQIDEVQLVLDKATDVPALLSMSPAEVLRKWKRTSDVDERRRLIAPYIEIVAVSPSSAGRGSTTFEPDRVRTFWRV